MVNVWYATVGKCVREEHFSDDDEFYGCCVVIGVTCSMLACSDADG
jgi:hypothetical protein